MATKSETADIAVLQTQMETMIKNNGLVIAKLDKIVEQIQSYVPRSEFEMRMEGLNRDITTFQLQQRKHYWLTSIATVLITATITGLVYLAFGFHI